MSDLWPGEAEIMEQHEWRMSEAPTAEILAATREYPKTYFKMPAAAPVRSNMTKRERKKACRKAGFEACRHGYPDPRGSICGPQAMCHIDYCPEYRAMMAESQRNLALLAA